MTSTATTRNEPARTGEPTTTTALPVPPPKLRRRPTLVAGAIAAICLGAVLAGWAWTATTDTTEVLVARTSIARGTTIDAEDLTVARISADPALRTVGASRAEDVVGKRAALDIAEGGLLTPDAFTSTAVPPSGKSVVGVALSAAQLPGAALQAGDAVRVVVTPGEGGTPSSELPAFSEAQVVAVAYDDESGLTVVDLLVPHGEAALVAARVATGNVALVLDSRER